MSVYPWKCYRCKARLPKGRRLSKCAACQRRYMATYKPKTSEEVNALMLAEFPGVDIDAVHLKRRWR